MIRILAVIAALWACAGASPALAQASVPIPPDSAWARYPQATAVRIEDAAAIVRVAPQMREDSAYVIVNPGPLPDPQVRVRGNRLVIDGGLDRRIEGCVEDGAVRVRGYGAVPLAQLPVVFVRTPESLAMEVSGTVLVEAGPSTSARVGLAGCSVVRLGAVTEQVSLALAGNASGVLGPAGRARVAIAGDGHAVLGPIGRGLDISIAGNGFVQTGALGGDVRVAVQGDGYVALGAGRIDSLRVAIAGDGHVRFAGEVGSVSAAIAGSGLIEVAHASGEVDQRVAGSGAVRVGPLGPAPPPPPQAIAAVNWRLP